MSWGGASMPDDYWVEVACNHKYRYIGGPIELPGQCDQLFADYGFAAASWARMEQHIDAILVQINKEQHSDEFLDLYDERHPGTFDTKIKMLRRYFNKHPALAQYTDTVIDCATGLKRLSKDRNELLHGVLEDYDPTKSLIMINGMQYRPATKDFLNRHQAFPAAKLEAFANLVNRAHYALCDVSKELFTQDAVARLRRPQRPARRWWRRLWGRFFG
jgi:hypothetical protein